MTLEGECNRPNATPEDADDLETLAEAQLLPGGGAAQEVIEILDEEEEEDHHHPAAGAVEENREEVLFPNDIPDFTPSINEINQSLNSIQEEIHQLALRSGTTTAGQQEVINLETEEGEDELLLDGEYEDLDNNLDKIDEALTKLDQENDLLQDKLRELLETLRANNQKESA